MKVWLRKGAGFDEEAAADREYWSTLFTPDERVALIKDLLADWDRMNGETATTNRDYADFLALLVKHDVRFVIIGAHAVAFHVVPRYTKDMDVLIDTSETNVLRVLKAIDEFGFGSLGLVPADLQPGEWVQLGVAPHRIDVTTRISAVTFEEAWASRVAGTYDDVPVHYIGREALIRNKTAVGRPKDLADLDALR
jgi:hypothetical protein